SASGPPWPLSAEPGANHALAIDCSSCRHWSARGAGGTLDESTATARCDSVLKDQACRRAMREQPTLVVRDPAFGRADPASAAQDGTFGSDRAGLRRNRSQQ